MMVFDGAFHVPSWLRQLAIHPVDLIAHCRLEEGGSFGPPTQGQIALADWLLADAVRAEREARKRTSPLFMGGVINRVLAGSIVPSDPMAESLGGMTGGAVTLAMFGREAEGVPAASGMAALAAQEEGPSPSHAGAWAPPSPVKGEGQVLLRGTLGSLPAGPLWRARRAEDGAVEVMGPAIMFRLDRSGAAGLRRALATV